VPEADPLASLRALQGAPVRRVRPSAAPGRADVERYLRYLRGPTAFGA
jgi:hypothetical protein